MKRAVLPSLAIVAAFVSAASFLLLQHSAAPALHPAELVGAETHVFIHLPDFRRSAERWPRTALSQLLAEPEVWAFLERPLAAVPALADWSSRAGLIGRIRPRQAFAAVTFSEARAPGVVAGFSFDGSPAAVERLIAASRATWSEVEPEHFTYGLAEIDVFTDGSRTVAETIRDGWYFVSNRPDLLQETLDRFDGKPVAGGSLLGSELFKQTQQPLPADGDLLAFGKTAGLPDPIAAYLAAAGIGAGSRRAALGGPGAFGAATHLDGAEIRDTLFLLAPGTDEPLLPRRALAFSGPDTVLFLSSRLAPLATRLPEWAGPLATLVPGLPDLGATLVAQGIGATDFGAIFGPEVGTLLTWPRTDASSEAAGLVFALDVRDAPRVRSLLEALAKSAPGRQGWSRQERAGFTLFTAPSIRSLPIPPLAITLSDDAVFLGFGTDSTLAHLNRVKAGGGSLGDLPSYNAIATTVPAPTTAFGYLDLRRLFESGYPMVRPFLALMIALNPEAARDLDAGKLPPMEAVAKHLSPTVISQSVSEQGTLIVSVGAVTFTQILAGALSSVPASAFPSLNELDFDPLPPPSVRSPSDLSGMPSVGTAK